MSAQPASLVFLLDCDNTLLDNDALKADLDRQLGVLLGAELNAPFWELYEAVRQETETVNFPVVLERFAPLCPSAALMERARAIIMDYPFAARLYPDTLAALDHLDAIGQPAILSDGDPIYQPRKIARSGLAAAVRERVLVYTHKEDHLDEVMARWPAALYVAVDDKARILAAMRARESGRFVTVHVRQGHYGTDPAAYLPAPDLTLDTIAALRNLSAADFARLASARGAD
ncbi:MAG TPA: hypothetical protein VIG30_11100 [Ktedonobacterales bacterium]|jgi:FMN phosphatase YigB (HAD superfamily)